MAQPATLTQPASARPREAGAAQGLTIVASGYMPMLAVLALPPVLPSMAAAFHQVPGAAAMVPMLVALPGLMVAILAWSAGSLLDRFGRRTPFVMAIALFVVAGVLPAFVGDFPWVVGSRIVLGAAQSVIMVASSTLLIDYFSDGPRRTWLTVQGVFSAAAAPVTVALAGFVGARSWQYAFLLYGLAIPILIATFLYCFEPDTKSEHVDEAAASQPFPWRLALTTSAIVLFCATFFFLLLIHAGLALGAVGVKSSGQIGGLIALMTLGAPIGAAVFNLASRKLPTSALMALTVLLLGAGVLGVGASPNKVVMVAFGMLQQVGGGMMVPTMIFWGGQLFSTEHRGRGLGLFSAASFLGQFLCVPILNVAEAASGGLLPAFLVLGGVAIAGAGVIAFVARPKALSPAAA